MLNEKLHNLKKNEAEIKYIRRLEEKINKNLEKTYNQINIQKLMTLLVINNNQRENKTEKEIKLN